MKKLVLILIVILFTSCSKQKLSKENLMSAYRIGWLDGFKEGIKKNNYEWSVSQRKIDESLFYLKFHAIFESLPTKDKFKINE